MEAHICGLRTVRAVLQCSLSSLVGPERPGFPRAAPVGPRASDNRERGPQRLVHLITSQTVQSVR